jgi:hypothetical protein
MSYDEDITSPQSNGWIEAMESEVNDLLANNTWELIKPPIGSNIVTGKWVYSIKRDSGGNFLKFKARWVARGFTQKYGIDYNEIFSPTSHLTSVRLVLSLAAINNWELMQFDIRTALLNANLEEDIYVNQPDGFTNEGQEHLKCKLNKALYGLKQAPRQWNERLDSWFARIGFYQLAFDPTIYVKRTDGQITVALSSTCVDDILITSSSMKSIKEVENHLKASFQISKAGEADYFLGAQIIRNRLNRSVSICQESYIESILKDYGMTEAYSKSVPMAAGTGLDDPQSPQIDATICQKVIGRLLYLPLFFPYS